MSNTAPQTAALYARFSSQHQKDTSTDDQLALCRQIAKIAGLKVAAEFADRQTSGMNTAREGLRRMMAAAKDRQFDVVITEDCDRLSRDQEDLPGLYKRLKFFGVELRDRSGVVTPMHIAFKGLQGSQYIADLGARMRRGQSGSIDRGKVPGSVSYGYRRVVEFERADGSKIYKPGEREPDPKEAPIVQRIFTRYASGHSTRRIAADLNADRIPAPAGGLWRSTTILTGNAGRGIISNQLYIGKLVWNFERNELDPDTRKRVKRRNAATEHKTKDFPHLRIIDQNLWDAAQRTRAARTTGKRGGRRRGVVNSPRSPHVLSGLLRCGECGGPMRITSYSDTSGRRVTCSVAHDTGKCEHARSYGLDKLLKVVINGMKTELTNPEAVKAAARAYHDEYESRQAKNRTDAAAIRKKLLWIDSQQERLATAIAESDRPVKKLTERLDALETEKVQLEERLRVIQSEAKPITLHPDVMKTYHANVTALADALAWDALAPKTAGAFRNLIERIEVHPTPKWGPYEVTPYGRLGAILGVELFPSVRSAEQIVAAEGVPGCATRETQCVLGHTAGSAWSKTHSSKPQIVKQKIQVIPLGRWREAA